MFLPEGRGPLSRWVRAALGGSPLGELPPVNPQGILQDADAQLALWMLYEMHYQGFTDADPALEWDPRILDARRCLEEPFEAALRDLVSDVEAEGADVAEQVQWIVDNGTDAGLAGFLQRTATRAQFLDYLRQRSVYHLKESDAHSFVLPRVSGTVKVALAELQYDEYGSGRPERLHQRLFAEAMEACDLDPAYGRYVSQADALTLANNNALSLFALHRRLRGAALGHLAAFEMTSSVPCRRICGGVERLELPAAAGAYFDEHVEADAVHEQVALHDICGQLVAQDGGLAEDVVFGAAICVELGALADQALLDRWAKQDREQVVA